MFGKFSIYLSLFAGVMSVLAYIQAALGNKKKLTIGRIGLYVSALGIFLASGLLLVDILLHNFENGYVWSYSSRDLPWHFLLSTFWAGQEGSFMFWALCSALLSIFLLSYTRRRELEAHVLTVFLVVQTFLVVLLAAKSPFKTIFEQFPGQLAAGQIPHDGRGLNPLLQNLWMVIHPPILFIGFAAMAIPFSFAVAALWRKDYHGWLTSTFPWVIFSGLALGAGLMLGAYWAYGVLGWGGYWGWDPVENSSLIPWILSMALLHTMLVQARTGNLVRTNFIFAILSFVFVIYSTFLTRSGVLGDSSVHSFTDPGTIVYGLLLIFLATTIVFGFGFLFVRRKELKAIAKPMHWLTREFALSIGSFVLLASAIIVFFGTSLPLFSKTQVDATFYNTMNLPVAILVTLLIGYSLLVRWEQEDGTFLKEKSWKSLLGAFVGMVVIAFFSSFNIVHMLFIFASLFALFVNVEIAYLTARGNFKLMGGKIAHIGIAVFLIGVILSGNYDQKKSALLELNTPQEIFGYNVTYTGRQHIEGHKTAFAVTVQKDGSTATLLPVMFETQDQGVMRNPDIESFLTKDFYISPVGVEESKTGGDGNIMLRKEEHVVIGGASVTFSGFDMKGHDAANANGGMKVGTTLEITAGKEKETVIPYVIFGGGEPKYYSADSKLLKGKVQLLSMNIGGMGDGKSVIEISLLQDGQKPKLESKEVLTVEASVKPFIMLVWIGTLLLFAGFIISIQRRRKADVV
ncbi:MAG: cytochrome c biogenesis protein CcsA [Bacteroidota bacterium]|nr:cytochrome c biogenesis protein CcsA [Bacteroidota bacterium]